MSVWFGGISRLTLYHHHHPSSEPFSSCKPGTPYPLSNNSPFLPPPQAWHSPFYFLLNEFDYSGFFRKVESSKEMETAFLPTPCRWEGIRKQSVWLLSAPYLLALEWRPQGLLLKVRSPDQVRMQQNPSLCLHRTEEKP